MQRAAVWTNPRNDKGKLQKKKKNVFQHIEWKKGEKRKRGIGAKYESSQGWGASDSQVGISRGH